MTGTDPVEPHTPTSASSDEYGFDEERHPLEKDEAQAEASKYGIYGYADEPGQELEQDEGLREQDLAQDEPRADSRDDDEIPAAQPAVGSQDWDETEHGAGFGQPLEEPQRSASRSPLPGEEPRARGSSAS
jgi:hypothetical protein